MAEAALPYEATVAVTQPERDGRASAVAVWGNGSTFASRFCLALAPGEA